MKNLLFILILTLTSKELSAQFNSGYVFKNNVVVIENSQALINPWSGGLNNPQISEVDINLDGVLDLFVFEKDGKTRKTFRYDTATSIYRWDSSAFAAFPKSEGAYMLLRDYDNDGDMDVFRQPISAAGIDVFQNTSTSALEFSLEASNLLYSRKGKSSLYFLLATGQDLPAIDDMDGDGDLDVIFQSSGGVLQNSNVLFYVQGMSMEKYGVPDSLVFTLKNECWGSISEYISNSGWTDIDCSDTIGQRKLNLDSRDGERHGSTTLTSFDLNGDGNTDLLVGDSYVGSMIALFGDSNNLQSTVDLSSKDSNFPIYDTPINIPSLSAAYMIDVDHDGIKDLIAAPNQPTYLSSQFDSSINTHVDWYYHNSGTPQSPLFELEKRGLLNAEMIDVGTKSYPALVDLTGDGLLDLIIGNEGFKVYGGTSSASLTYYKNVGSTGNPIFELVSKDFAGVSDYGFGFAHPTFADLDNDGDNDMMIGDDQGMLHYFRNAGNPNFPQFLLVAPEFRGIDVDLAAHPQFFDLSTDGIPDLIVGDYYGRLQYFENSGTAEEYAFSPTPNIKKLGGLQLYNSFGGDASPYFTRFTDSTLNTYAFVGTAEGTVLAFGPITDIFDPLIAIDSIKAEATHTAITGGNLSGDLRDELIIGQRTGGLYYLKRDKDVQLSVKSTETTFKSTLHVYPNPSHDLLNISLPTAKLNSTATITLVNITGKNILLKKVVASNGNISTQISLQSLQSGFYILNVEHDDQSYFKRIIKE